MILFLGAADWLQWNLSWETTALRDHLSGRTTSFWQKLIHFSVNEPVTVLRDHIFMANGVVFQDGFYCINTGSYCYGICSEAVLKTTRGSGQSGLDSEMMSMSSSIGSQC